MKVLQYELKLLCLIIHFIVFNCQEIDEAEGGDFLFMSKNLELPEEVRLSRSSDKKSHKDKGKSVRLSCNESTLISFLSSIQVINPESLISLATKNKLEKKCHNISKTVDHMESYLKSCDLMPEQQLYAKLMNGVKALHKKLCTKDNYHKDFMKNRKCYGQMQAELADSCNGPADWCDSVDSKRVCRAYQEIKDCYYIKASILCGEKAAHIFRELVQCIIESIITVSCTEDSTAGMTKEQLLLMKKQKLLESGDEAASSRPLHTSGYARLLTILSTVCLAKIIEFTIQIHYSSGQICSLHC